MTSSSSSNFNLNRENSFTNLSDIMGERAETCSNSSIKEDLKQPKNKFLNNSKFIEYFYLFIIENLENKLKTPNVILEVNKTIVDEQSKFNEQQILKFEELINKILKNNKQQLLNKIANLENKVDKLKEEVKHLNKKPTVAKEQMKNENKENKNEMSAIILSEAYKIFCFSLSYFILKWFVFSLYFYFTYISLLDSFSIVEFFLINRFTSIFLKSYIFRIKQISSNRGSI
ncbi:hypothetical protein Mgra_00003437 [Meloidogyne graminicola]|uniref:Uncharacterized protein n=1 Tax=Meloidogyne graminicola TaxID=189291 RepID=A0A8S9ZUU1_9BILA|nr:hypothetical protein Mgra_00003437 [Meloidogyne graminicola]